MPREFGHNPEEERLAQQEAELSPEMRAELGGEIELLEENLRTAQQREVELGDFPGQMDDAKRRELEAKIVSLQQRAQEHGQSVKGSLAALNPKEALLFMTQGGGYERLSAILGYASGGVPLMAAGELLNNLPRLLRDKYKLRGLRGKLQEAEEAQ